MSGNKVITNIDNNSIEPEDIHELLGIIIDSKLAFKDHVNKLCKKACQNLSPLVRVSNYTIFCKTKIIMKAFIISQFSYCRTLRITYGDKTSSFSKLLEKETSVTIYHKSLQPLATEMKKVSNNMFSTILNDIFGSRAPLITSVTLLVLKCEQYIRCTMLLKLYHT